MVHRLLIVLIAPVSLLGCSFLTATSGAPAAGPLHSLTSPPAFAAGYTPVQLETAYNFTPLLGTGIDGTGQTIALIELDTFRLSDIQQFDRANGLPAPTVRQYYVGGKRFKLQNDGEATMDLEWVHALAPGAAIQIYYLNLDRARSMKVVWTSLSHAVKQAAAHGAKTISMSFSGCTPTLDSGYKTTQSALATVEQQGVSVFVSSGDDGALSGPPDQCGPRVGVGYPASDPSVVSVGGTSLVINGDNRITGETAWQYSGGGEGKPLLRAPWQIIAQLVHAKYRWAPDVAFDAAPRTGVAVFEKGQWQEMGGTSLGAPAWAAIWALVRQAAQQAGKFVGAAPPILYRIANSSAYAKAFHDIMQGDNGYYRATVGWDPLTGWGTPDVAQFAAAVLAGS